MCGTTAAIPPMRTNPQKTPAELLNLYMVFIPSGLFHRTFIALSLL